MGEKSNIDIRSAVLVASDRSAAGVRPDASGPAAVEALEIWTQVVDMAVIPDEYEQIREKLLEWCRDDVDLVFTLGGTGLSPRDVTPEATRAVIEKEAQGITAALLYHGLQDTPKAMLSRAVAGVCGRTLIINLPGKPAAVTDGINYLKDALPHAVEVVRGEAKE